MSLATSTLVDNALFFGAALTVVLIASFVASRLTTRLLGLGLGGSGGAERELLQKMLARRTSRVIVMLSTVLSLALISAAALFSAYEIDVVPPVWAWFETALLRDPVALGWLSGQLVLIALAAFVIHRLLRALVDLVIDRLQGTPTLLRYHEQFARLRARVATALRWSARLGVLLAAVVLLESPPGVEEVLTLVLSVVVGVLTARALTSAADVGVDIAFQLVRTFEGRRHPLRYVGRLEHLARITKRTFEYLLFVGTGTFLVHNLRPDTWAAQTGLVAIRLIALVYVGRVVIEVFGLALREAMLANPDQRTEAEHQQRLTLVPVATSILRYAVYFCMAVMGLQEIGVDASPILAGAGLLGLAVGLGAQTLVGDVVSGFFILFEGLFLVGDRIRVGDVIGNVEEIGVRVLKIRDEYGVLHCIPNGEVRLVANHARQYVNAVVEFTLPYEDDVPAVLDRLRSELSGRRSMHPDILADTEFIIQDLKDTGALIRSSTRVKPSQDDAVAEVLRGELLAALTRLGVVPSACQVVSLRRTAKGHASREESRLPAVAAESPPRQEDLTPPGPRTRP